MRMLFLFHGLFHKTKLSLVFQCSVILLQLADLCRGQSWGVGSSQTVVALVGDDVTLPCHLEPAVDVYFKSVEWGRPDLDPKFVHVWYEGRNLLVNQNPSYKGRTSVSTEKLRRGDLSLSLSAVKHSDNGKYRCYFPPLSKETNVRLIVGSVSSALITGIKLNNSVLDVQCKSEGWYPEPEVLWLNSEGNPLSVGPAETLKGPDGLFTVSRRLTVEKTNRDSFICRVKQNSINQIRDTHIQMSAQITESKSAVRIIVVLAAFCSCFIALCFVLWKKRPPKTEPKGFNGEDESTEQLNKPSETQNYGPDQVVDPSEEQRKITLDLLEGQRKTVGALEEQKKNLFSLVQELKDQEKGMMENLAEMERRLEAAMEVPDKDKAKQYFELINFILWIKKQLKERKKGDSKLLTDAQMLLHKTDHLHQNLETKLALEERSSEINQESQSAAGV